MIGGYLSDRFPRRQVVVLSTFFDAGLAAVLAATVLADVVSVWHIYLVALGGGLAQSINQPARQAFVYDVTDGLLHEVRPADGSPTETP